MKMKKILLPLLLLLSAYAVAPAYDRGGVYINGTIQYLSGDEITISGDTYQIDPNCEILMQYREKDALHVKKASRWDLRVGESVWARNMGRTLLQIQIEGWKR